MIFITTIRRYSVPNTQNKSVSRWTASFSVLVALLPYYMVLFCFVPVPGTVVSFFVSYYDACYITLDENVGTVLSFIVLLQQ